MTENTIKLPQIGNTVIIQLQGESSFEATVLHVTDLIDENCEQVANVYVENISDRTPHAFTAYVWYSEKDEESTVFYDHNGIPCYSFEF